MDLICTPLGHLDKLATEEPASVNVGPVEGAPDYSGVLSKPVLKQWGKNTLVLLGGLGLGLGAGHGLYSLARRTKLHERWGHDPKWIRPAAALAGAGALQTGYLVRQKQRELLDRAQQEGTEQRNPTGPGEGQG